MGEEGDFFTMGENTNFDILESITVTTRHVTASQNWVGNKPKILLWHSQAKNQSKM